MECVVPVGLETRRPTYSTLCSTLSPCPRVPAEDGPKDDGLSMDKRAGRLRNGNNEGGSCLDARTRQTVSWWKEDLLRWRTLVYATANLLCVTRETAPLEWSERLLTHLQEHVCSH